MPENEFPKLRPHPFRSPQDAPIPERTTATAYAELCVTSNYTFLTGASHPEEFVMQAAALGYTAIGIADTNTLAGVVRAHVAARQAGIRFVLGARLLLTDCPECPLCVYPTDMPAYRRLCRLLTLGKRRTIKGQCSLSFDDLASHSQGLLAIAMPQGQSPIASEPVLRRLRKLFDDDRLSLALCMRYDAHDARRLEELDQLSTQTNCPLVATNDAHYHAPDRRMLHDVVTCIRHTCTLPEAGFRLNPNAERHLKPPDEMARLLAAHPGAIARTNQIAARTSGFSLDALHHEYPEEIVPHGTTPQVYLTELTWHGARKIYAQGVPDKVRSLLEHELKLIDELSYAPYFLTVYDLVRYARTGVERLGDTPPPDWTPILCQGRGAAANSAVCFCLGVTAVDPTRIDMLFERFISRERNEPPDIDIDFEHERREEVIQYIYRKYGREHAALTAEVISYRRRSAVRDVGKALGLSLDLVDRLAKDIEWFDAGVLNAQRLLELGLNPDDPTLRWLGTLVSDLLSFPRHLSQHVGGFVITRSPLCELVPVENAAMPDRTVIEWDKDDIDAMGLLKVDVLGLGMLTAIRKAMDLVNARRHGGTKAQRHKVETQDEHNSDLSGSSGLATRHATGKAGLHSDVTHAGFREVRTNESDATSSRVDPVEHSGGIRQASHRGLPPIPTDLPGLTRGTLHTVRTGDRDGDDQARSACAQHTERTGPHAPISHHEDPEQTHSEVAAFLHPSCHCASVPLCLRTIPPQDPATYEMIQHADTVGVFQIESRAQMSMLPRLKPRVFYDLVIEVAIVRPGPIQGGMVHPYLRRRNGDEPVPPPPHPAFEKVLGKTFGVPLFQEQCMALAVEAAGFTAGEADQLRRAMAAWKRKGDQIYRFGQKLIEGMKRNGIPEEFAARCFEQIKGFSEYGFPESHAASFALLVYASAWLKRHHPAEFTAALLNSQPMGFYAPAQLIRDAREHDVVVRPIDVNHSRWDCTIEPDGAIRLGMRLVNAVGQRDAEQIRASVERDGPAPSMLALWRRCRASARSLRRLAAADAFGSMGLSRQQALWQARLLKDESLPLFETHSDSPATRTEPIAGDGYDALPVISPRRQVVLDYDATGLSLKAHPVSFSRPSLRRLGAVTCDHLRDPNQTPAGEITTVAGLVLVRQRPGTANNVTFITLEDETGIANLIVWYRVYQKYRRAAASRLLLATGRVQREGEVVHIVVTKLRGIDEQVEGLEVRSRNFH